MCQGLPYWASGGPPLLSPCNNYEIRCTDNEDPPSWRYWADYTDCYGVLQRQYVSIGNPWGPRSVNICSNTVPVPGTDRPFGSTPVTVTSQGACGANIPIIPCGRSQSFQGGQTFPSHFKVNLGPMIGNFNIKIAPYTVPDKFVLRIDGNEVFNSGYMGDSSYQSALNTELTNRGLPTETIVPWPGPTYQYPVPKNTSTSIVDVYVYAPLPETVWLVEVFCPY